MPFQLSEKCLMITQIKGHKQYGGDNGYTFTLPIVRVTHTRTVNKESTTGGPGGIPISILMGQQPDQVRLEITWNYNEFKQLLIDLAPHRLINNAANVFLVGSILTQPDESNLIDEMPKKDDNDLDVSWLVDTFSLRRSINRRGIVVGDLALIRCNASHYENPT